MQNVKAVSVLQMHKYLIIAVVILFSYLIIRAMSPRCQGGIKNGCGRVIYPWNGCYLTEKEHFICNNCLREEHELLEKEVQEYPPRDFEVGDTMKSKEVDQKDLQQFQQQLIASGATITEVKSIDGNRVRVVYLEKHTPGKKQILG